MSASSMLITDAGIAEVINAEKNGTAPVVLTHVGLGTGQYEPTSDLTALKAEFKRLSTISGGAVGDNRIHVSVNDASNDAYTVYEVGIFTASGTLFAVAARKIPIIQKAAVSEAYLSIDFDVNNLDPDSVTIGDTNFPLNGATSEKRGIVELATAAETIAGRDGSRVVTPAGLSARTATTERTGLVRIGSTVRVAKDGTIDVGTATGDARDRDASGPNYGLA